ncbi:pyridoxamine 5'-phosphate oxidase family protein [Labedaea rhizosphaerae]|uniref:Pyridoxamine 5'-phosphate oxidase n=1 Tax=Labedaea rhizosphaerae TaxID=598644 RepID=A0A4R6RRE5_LABRH|nr:pyridoxamine 5'-phosphate oxidase family protein [Labedaea rhizosphaerae]TDP89391.1 pyridoxamine 5'-phosphate oxidase [Labedaea rhizosphaerae]
MTTSWAAFAEAAPRIAEVFARRHAAAHNLCMLGTLRADGYPRISPMEPRLFEDRLCLVGMPGTRKFRDLARDPRFSLHTATVDPQVTEGDAKLWGVVADLRDEEFHQRFAQRVFEEIGLDLRGRKFSEFYVADIRGASSVRVVDGVEVTSWRDGEAERVVRK